MDYAKSYDAVVFDVLKVTPEEFAVSMLHMSLSFDAAYQTEQISPEAHYVYLTCSGGWRLAVS